MIPWANSTLPFSRHLYRFSHVCRAQELDQPTDTQTDTQSHRPCYSICSNRPRLMHWVYAMWPNNNTHETKTRWHYTPFTAIHLHNESTV